MSRIVLALFGTSPVTTILGLLGSAAIELALVMDALPPEQGAGWHLLAVILLALGRAAKDAGRTGGTVPVTAEARERVRPSGFAGVGLLVALAIAAAVFVATPARAAPFVYCISGCETATPASSMKLQSGETPLRSDAQIAPTLWLGPSVGIDSAIRYSGDNSWTVGFVPGVSYGLKWRPAGWTMTQNALALDLALSAAFTDDTFDINVLPSVTVIDWFSVGFGRRFRLATAPDQADDGGWLFAVGIRKSLGAP